VKARQAQLNAEVAEQRATTETAIARAVNDFLQKDLLSQAEVGTQLGQLFEGSPYLTVKEALDRAAAQIDQRFQNQPLVEAAIRTTIGRTYSNVRDDQRAVTHLERAVALRAHLGLNDPDLISSMDSLVGAYSWVGRFSDAITLSQRVLEHKRTLLGPAHPDVLACLEGLGNLYGSAGQWDLSVPLLEQVLEKRRAIEGPNHPETLGTMQGLGLTYLFSGRVAESIPLFQYVLDHLPPTTPPVFTRMCLANACYKAGKLHQSEHLHRETLAELATLPDSFWRRLTTANASGFLARTLLQQERIAEAEPLVREAVAFFEKHRPDDRRHFYWINLLGAVLAGQHRYDEAEPLLLQGYQRMKNCEALMTAGERRRLAQAGERVVRLYEETGQTEKASFWRENAKFKLPDAASAPAK
jgi:tetratricopeptide (TPR) repeat protein